ncbi:MAG: InlB B-repeat-containing protein, partial [Oscillospiraceae bacterium]|nr:InlB B-repeat-containing protein [Oscillospiraceae bacterium]
MKNITGGSSLWVMHTALFAAALCIVLCVLMLSPGGTHAAPTPDESVANFSQLQTAVANGNMAGSGGYGYVIEVTADIPLSAPLNITGDTTIYGSTGNEQMTITSGRHFNVGMGGSLTLQDITLDGGTAGGGVEVTGGALALDHATIQNCYMNGYGGGVSATNSSTVTVQNDSTVVGNISAWSGGGIYASNSDVIVSGSTFTNNEALDTGDYNGFGGGIYLYVLSTGEGSIRISDNSLFDGNDARVGGGVASFNYNSISSANVAGDKSSVTVADSDFKDNNADWSGGGVYSSTGDVDITGCSFEENTAAYGAGVCVAVKTAASGSAVATQSNTVTITGTEFISNVAAGSSGYGGGVYTSTYGDATIDGCLFDQNQAASYGGGLASDNGPLTIMNTDLTNNTAGGSGGGIYANSWNKLVTLSGCTLTGNSASEDGGGADLWFCNLSVTDCVMEDNTATDGSGGALWASLFSEGTIQNSRLTNNSANSSYGGGGGIYLSSGDLNISGTTIEKNEATTGNGGGICTYGSDITITAGTLQQNTAVSGNGGGVFIQDGLLSVIDTAFTGNRADNGGAVYLGGYFYVAPSGEQVTYAGTLSASGDSSFIGNIADTDGGAIFTGITDDYGIVSTGMDEYANIVTAATTAFDGNKASQAYLPPTDADALYPAILYSQVSTWNHPLNNDDINYVNTNPTYTLTYDDNYSSPSGVYDGGTYYDGDTVAILGYSDTGLGARSGYTFQGWNTESDGGGTSYTAGDSLTVTVDTVLYAQWKKDSGGGGGTTTYSVTYNANGGSGSYRDASLSKNTSYTIRTHTDAGISYSGYTFAGWNTAADGTGTSYTAGRSVTITGSMTLYAVWRDGTDALRVTYYASDATSGTVPVDSTSYSEGDSVTVLYNTGLLRRSGYYFSGWAFSETGGTVLRPGTQFVIGDADVQLYARWSTLTSGSGDLETLYDADVPLAALTTDHIWYIQGYPDNSVRPEGNLTRAEAAAIFYRLIDDESGKAQTGYTVSFSDMSQSDWYYHEVSYLTNRGILFG